MIYVFYILTINIVVSSIKVVALAIDESGLNLLGVKDMYDEFKNIIQIAVPIFALLIGMIYYTFFDLGIFNMILCYFIAIHFFDIVLERWEKWLLSKISE